MGVNGKILLVLDETAMAAHPEDVDALRSLTGVFASIGLSVSVVPRRRCSRSARQAGQSKVVVRDQAEKVLYSHAIRACAPLDLADLIDCVGDVADGD